MARPASLATTLVLAGCLCLMAPATAFGHAAFVGSSPEPGTRLETAPDRIVLTFTEPLNRGLSRVSLAEAGEPASAVRAEASGDRRVVVRPQRTLATGAYRVEWHTVSTEDGHALEGEFSFGVRAPAAGGVHELEQSPLARAGWVRVALRLVFYAAVLLLGAALLVPLLLRSPGGSWLAPPALDEVPGVSGSTIRARESTVVGDLAWLALGAAAAVTVAEAADAAGSVSVDGLREFLLSGGSGPARLAQLGALTVAAATAVWRPRWAALAVVVAFWGIAASGHAASAAPRAPSVLNDWVHLMAGSVWLGGIGLLVLVWWPALRRSDREVRQAVARHVLPAYGRVALPAFLLAVATGLVSLLVQLGHLDALWTTGYGRVLAVKIALVFVVAAVSFFHALRLRPRLVAANPHPRSRLARRHWRLVRSEPLAGLGVIVAVAVLVAFPLPPRQLSQADEEAAAAPPSCDPCPLPAPKRDELSVADHAGSQLVAAWLRRDGARLSGTIRVLDIRGKPSRNPVDVLGTPERPCGPGCREFSLGAADAVRVAVKDRGRRHLATLPASWDARAGGRARRLLERAEARMRRLRTVREVEEVTSGPGSYARTEYRLRAPDRMALATNAGAQSVIVGESQWFRGARDQPWTRQRYGSRIPFSTRRWFRWTPYGRAVSLLDRRREAGRRVAELALADEATPVWFRLVVDERSGRVLRGQMSTKAHFSTLRYFAFNEPLTIRQPHVR